MNMKPGCPDCGKPLPPHVPLGLCPECLLKAGFNTGPETDNANVRKGGFVPPPVGDLAGFFPQLEIIECVGQGGMGVVYKARQPKLDRLVALKILSRQREEGITDAEFAARFQQEARALARLNHPDIVAVHDFGEAGGYHYLLMEYVDGLTLRQLLQTGKLSPEQALAIVPKICEALQFAHERGIVHRDIKPENILLDKQGQVKIADFGIAKILRGESAGRTLTGVKDVIGTPHYMAPEQVERPATVDHRADIYSLGVVFYEMLTGELPLGRFQSPSRMVQVDVRLDEVVLHALEKNPDRRYQHASQVKKDVETIATTAPEPEIRGSKSEVETRLASMERRRRMLLWYGFIVCLIGLPVGLALKLPYVWFLSMAGIVIAAMKLGLLGGQTGTLSQKAREDQSQLTSAAAMRWVTAARWTARVFSMLLLAFYGFFILGEGLPPIASQPEGVQFNFAALGLMLLGFIIGWKREGAAALLIAAGWSLWRVSEGHLRWDLFHTPLPVAALNGYCWWATHGRKTHIVATALILLAAALGLGWLFLPANVLVRGAVLDAQTGKPVPGAALTVQPAQRGLRGDLSRPSGARSREDGQFSLCVGWYTEQKQVTISAAGYATVTTNLGPRAPGHRTVSRNFFLSPHASPVDFGDAPLASAPPVVVRTVPESGTADVDPALTELRVTFSTPMQDGTWAWTTWGEGNVPEVTGESHYLPDGRTCILPVRLQPGRLYATWLNSESHMPFTDTQGRSAIPYLLIFETRK